MEKGTIVIVIGSFSGRVPVGEYIGKTDSHYVIKENGVLTPYRISNRLEEVK